MKKINFLNYLESFMPAGAGSINGERTELTDIGLKLSLINAEKFIPSLIEFNKTIGLDSIVIKQMDVSVPVTKTGEAFNKNKSDKAGPIHRYDLVYEPIFEELGFNNSLNILEIGLGTNNFSFVSHVARNGRPGASLFAYKELFPNAQIFGADIDRGILFEEERIKTSFVDQLVLSSFQEMHDDFNKPEYDLLIEDGLHSITASLNTLIFGLQTVKKGGFIVLEDLYNPNQVWNSLTTLLNNSNTIQSGKLVDSRGTMLVVKK